MVQEKLYRPNVGIAVFNDQGQLLICKWDTSDWAEENKKYAWQAPQGGIDEGETPLEAAYREIKEETNIDRESLQLIKEASQAYHYDFPEKHFKHRGQEQTWFAFRFLGDDREIDVINCPDPCFVDWRWEEFDKVPPLIIDFKRSIYETLINEFKEI